MNVLSFDRNVKLNALFHKTSGKKAIVYCDMEMQGEHKVLSTCLYPVYVRKMGYSVQDGKRRTYHKRISNIKIDNLKGL